MTASLKVELHTHTADDPLDRVPHTALELIDRASALGYGALAITLHERQLEIDHLQAYAKHRGIVLIPGVERSIQGRHVLLLNFTRAAEDVKTFEDLARLRQSENGLVVAPHPYFPARNCLFRYLDRFSELFDAVEYNAMYTPALNFNRRAQAWALKHGKPIVGNCDVHRLSQLGTTYSLVEAEPDPGAICAAIAQGRVKLQTQPLTWRTAISTMASLMLMDRGSSAAATRVPGRPGPGNDRHHESAA
jgi:predicted metal-dependent phosphoesterase TrpH